MSAWSEAEEDYAVFSLGDREMIPHLDQSWRMPCVVTGQDRARLR